MVRSASASACRACKRAHSTRQQVVLRGWQRSYQYRSEAHQVTITVHHALSRFSPPRLVDSLVQSTCLQIICIRHGVLSATSPFRSARLHGLVATATTAQELSVLVVRLRLPAHWPRCAGRSGRVGASTGQICGSVLSGVWLGDGRNTVTHVYFWSLKQRQDNSGAPMPALWDVMGP